MSMSMSLLCKVFNNIAWMSAPLLQGEMAPTSMRNIFYGVIGFVGEIGSISAPYFDFLKKIHESAPFIVIAGMSFLAAFASLCSPETKGKPMPEDLDQINPGFVYNYLFGGKSKSKEHSLPTSSVECMPLEIQQTEKLLKEDNLPDLIKSSKTNPS